MSDRHYSDKHDFEEREDRQRLQERRAFRLEARKRRARRNRAIAIAVAIALIVTAVVISPWGPLKGVIYASKKAPNSVVAKITKTKFGSRSSTSPKSTTPAAPAHYEKKSVTAAPAVAIVVDDTGNVTDKLPLWQAIDAPLSFAVMPYPPLCQTLAEQLYQSGYVIMMHVPTDNAPPNSFSGTGQLATGMDRQTVFSTLDSDVAKVPHVVGINNHQGGRGCDQVDIMTYEVEWAKSKGYYVVDSNSSLKSKVTQACLALGLPKRLNQVFLDHQNDPEYIRGAMRELAGIARKNGTAIGICHWHRPNTATVVGEMINTLRTEGIHFAFVRDITN
ncbi:MAG TPA: divergent polysaccharide deacetylase family protein [Candidatus Anoxymicrobiaceae bacterium]